jgi:tetratricopeptide (TPR) repeat protein
MLMVALALPFIQRRQELLTIQSAIDREDLVAARSELQDFLARRPNDAEGIYLLGSIARRQGDLLTFRNCMELARQKTWPTAAIEFQERLLDIQLGKVDPKQQEELFSKGDQATSGAVISDSVAAQIYQAIAYGYLATYRLKEAWEASEFWLQWQPKSIAAHLLKADIYERIGDPPSAIKELELALQIDAKHPAARAKLGRLQIEAGQIEQAIQHIEGLVSEGKASPSVQLDFAEALLRSGKSSEAKRALQDAFQIGLGRQDRARASSTRGRILMEEGKWEAAAADLLVAIEIAPDDSAAYFALSNALSRLGQGELSDQYRERGTTLLQAANDNFRKIRELLAQILDRPTDPALRTNVGRMMIEQGKIPEGLRWVETALQYDPNYTPAQEIMRQYYPTNPG